MLQKGNQGFSIALFTAFTVTEWNLSNKLITDVLAFLGKSKGNIYSPF
jgi:hypothetical protein